MARIQRGLDELSCTSHRLGCNCQKPRESPRVEWVYHMLNSMTDEAKKKQQTFSRAMPNVSLPSSIVFYR